MANVVSAWKGHYEVEFSFNEEIFYVVNDYKENGERDIRVIVEQEYLLADKPEALFRLWDTAEESGIEGEIPAGMCFELEEAMNEGRKAARAAQ